NLPLPPPDQEMRFRIVEGLELVGAMECDPGPTDLGELVEDAGFLDNGRLRYEPPAECFTGPGSYLTFSFQAFNPGGESAVTQATIQVDEPAPDCDDAHVQT